MGKLISVVNQKGGVGKTTTVINLSAILAEKGKKVLVIDTDSQGNATTGLGIKKNEIKKSCYDLITAKEKIENIIIKTEFKNLDIVPASGDLASADLELSQSKSRLNMLKSGISPIKDDYDFIICDCPPALGLVTLNSLTASDQIIIPMVAEFYALEGLSQFINTFNAIKQKSNPDIEILGILFTMYDPRTNLSKEVAQEVEKYFPGKVFKTKVPRNIKLAEAPSFGKPISYYDKHSAGAESYKKLAKEILGEKSVISQIFTRKNK